MSKNNLFKRPGWLAVSVLGAAVLTYILFVGASGQEPEYNLKIADTNEYIKTTVKDYFFSTSSVLSDVQYRNGKTRIIFNDNHGHDYFEENDRIKEILTIESFKYFYKLPFLNEINYYFDLSDGFESYTVSKSELEKLFNVKLDEIRESRANMLFLGDKWNLAMKDYIDDTAKLHKLALNLKSN